MNLVVTAYDMDKKPPSTRIIPRFILTVFLLVSKLLWF